MAYQIIIDGKDRTAEVINQSPTVDDVINDQSNSCKLVIEDLTDRGLPHNNDNIVITLDTGEILFAGTIVRNKKVKVAGKIQASIECVDYTYEFDRNLVHRSYIEQTDKEIIEDIVSRYCAGFGITTNNVTEGATLSKIPFNYIQPSQAMRKIAELTGRSWYIDYQKDIHYFALTENPAPFNITTEGTNYKNLWISEDATQMRNRVYVRGGTKLSDFTIYTEKGDGTKTQFVLPDKPHDVSVTVNGVSKTVGIKNVDTGGFDWYVNFQEKYIEQDEAGVILTASDTLAVTYKYDIPILVAYEDTASIDEDGEREFAIFDKTISTTEAARDRAIAELTDYANDLIEGSFVTYENGFRSGQYINVDHTDYNVSADYLIQRVRAVSMGGGQYEYTVSIASAKTLGIIKFLIELLEQNRNLVELDDNEAVDELYNISDSLLSDSLLDNLTIDSAGPYNTWALADETSPKTVAKWDLFQWE